MDLEEIQQATHHLRPIMLDRSCSPAARARQRRARGVRIGLWWPHAGVADRNDRFSIRKVTHSVHELARRDGRARRVRIWHRRTHAGVSNCNDRFAIGQVANVVHVEGWWQMGSWSVWIRRWWAHAGVADRDD